MKKLTFAEFCAAFDLGPFVPLRQACKVEGVGMTKLYEKTGPKRQAAHLQKRQAVKPLGAGALRSLCTAPGNSRRLAGRMNGRNGPGRAPRATLALNGFCGPSEQFRGAQRSAQAHLTHFGVQPEVPSRIRAALPGELPRIMRRQVVTCEPVGPRRSIRKRRRRMTVHVLVTGTLFRAAEARKATSGRRYVKATLRAPATDNSSADFWDLITFSETAGAELSRLGDGERIAVQGGLKLELYKREGKSARIQRTVFVDNVLALRAPAKPKKPKAAPPGQATAPDRINIMPPQSSPAFDDDIPF